jgi:hypothetical protein
VVVIVVVIVGRRYRYFALRVEGGYLAKGAWAYSAFSKSIVQIAGAGVVMLLLPDVKPNLTKGTWQAAGAEIVAFLHGGSTRTRA